MISHTLISGTNIPKTGFEKWVKTVLGIYFGVACSQLAGPLKTHNVHLLQLTVQAAVLAVEVLSRAEWRNPAEIGWNPDPIH